MGYGEQTENRITSCERLYEARPKTKRAQMLALRYWLSGSLAGDRTHVHKAYHIAVTTLAQNAGDARLHLLCAFLCEELGETDSAAAHLAKLKPYRAGWKNVEPLLYGVQMYVSARIAQAERKDRAAKKIFRTLSEYNAAHRLPELSMLLGDLHLRDGQYARAHSFLHFAYVGGVTSPLLFAAAARYYRETDEEPHAGDRLFPVFLRWALARELDISAYLARWLHPLGKIVADDPALSKALYAAYGLDWVLEDLCRRMIGEGDCSAEALYYYKEAERKQLFLPFLNEFLILSADQNGEESVSLHALTQFLQNGRADVELKPFVYHLLLTNPAYAALAAHARDEMFSFGCYCLENRLLGRVYFSLYRFILQKAEEGVFTDAALIQTAENILQPVLFAYDLWIQNPKVKVVWVFEKEKKESQTYAVKDGVVRVLAASPQFAVHCFGEEMRTMPASEIHRRRLVEGLDAALLLRFFRKGHASSELLITLANHCVMREAVPEAYVPVLEAVMAAASIAWRFCMRASAALGHYHAAQGESERAAAHYRDLDENVLDDRDIEQMLLVYLNIHDFARATNLLVKRAECISDRSLFSALKQIAESGRYDAQIANVAYELILKSWYDKALISIVLAHYQGSQMEWQALSAALAALSVSERSLDEIILQNAIFTHMPDVGAQRVFARLCEQDGENPLVPTFVQYLVYEILVNGLEPVYEATAQLEAFFLRTNEHFTAYALAHVYLAQNAKTPQAEEILKQAVQLAAADGFIFPVFKQLRDKNIVTPYIEMHQPFLYRTSPGKQVLLVYRTEDDEAFVEMPMRYVRFGMYMAHIPHFFGETITYRFQEQMSTGSVSSKDETVTNNRLPLLDVPDDAFYAINAALINEQMFKYENVERAITERLKPRPRVKGRMV